MAARQNAERQGDDDALFVSPDGIVLEGTTANVWWREGEDLVTPALTLGILPGVTRAALLEVASRQGRRVQEGEFPLERLLGADEAFVTSSVREVMPVVRVDGLQIGDGTPGPAAQALQEGLRVLSG
jgi:branched-subunit amino acid aminotransferase/4-amino-4-deoxychorismate lyase